MLSQVVGMLRNWTTHLNTMSFLNQQVSETHSDLYKYKDHLSKAVSIFFLFGSHIFQQVVFLDDAIKSRATGPIHVVQVWIVVGEFRRVWD